MCKFVIVKCKCGSCRDLFCNFTLTSINTTLNRFIFLLILIVFISETALSSTYKVWKASTLENGQLVWLFWFWARIFSRMNCSTSYFAQDTSIWTAQQHHFWLKQQAVVRWTVKSLGSSLSWVPGSCPVLTWPLLQIPSSTQELKHTTESTCFQAVGKKKLQVLATGFGSTEKNQTSAVPHLVISIHAASSTLPSGQVMNI